MIELTPVAFDISRGHSKSKRKLASSIFCEINHKLRPGPIRAQYPGSGPMGGQEELGPGGGAKPVLDTIAPSPALNSVSVSDNTPTKRFFCTIEFFLSLTLSHLNMPKDNDKFSALIIIGHRTAKQF